MISLDGDSVFSADVGNLQRTSARYSWMWICWRILSNASTG